MMTTSSIIIQNITTDQLKEVIREVISEETQRIHSKEAEPTYYTREEVANKLNIALSTLHEYTREGKIKAHKIGRRVLYTEENLHNALKEVPHIKYKRG